MQSPEISSGISGEDAATGLEFAVAAMMFFTLLFGVVYFGLYFFILVSITNVAAESARASVPGATTAERVTLANAAANSLLAAYAPLINASNATVTPQQLAGNAGLFQVTVTYNFGALGLGVLGNMFPLPNTTPSVTIIVSNGGY
jgi:Flp pilus assembly protein TadG